MLEIAEKPEVRKAKQERFYAKYQSDPMRFQTEVLDVKPEYVWPKMVKMAESVRDFQRPMLKPGITCPKLTS